MMYIDFMVPLISIIIPTYNSDKYLKECLDSVLNQTYENIEVIIVDGNSSDDTINISKSYCKKNINWNLIITEKGVSHQRNIGLYTFKGDYCFFLDSDDYISENLINDLYITLTKLKLDLVTPEVHNIFLNGDVLVSTNIIEPVIIPVVTKDNFFSEGYDSFLGGPTKLFKKELVKNLKHDETISNGEDLLFNYQIVQERSIRYGLCKGAIYYYRHDNSLKNPADKRLNKTGYLFCNKMVDILKNMKQKDRNYQGALFILKAQLLLFMKSYISRGKPIPYSLKKSRIYMFKNTKGKFRYYYIFPRIYNIMNALLH